LNSVSLKWTASHNNLKRYLPRARYVVHSISHELSSDARFVRNPNDSGLNEIYSSKRHYYGSRGGYEREREEF
jgi:hypothetical protein